MPGIPVRASLSCRSIPWRPRRGRAPSRRSGLRPGAMTFEAPKSEGIREAAGDGSSFADHVPAAVVTAGNPLRDIRSPLAGRGPSQAGRPAGYENATHSEIGDCRLRPLACPVSQAQGRSDPNSMAQSRLIPRRTRVAREGIEPPRRGFSGWRACRQSGITALVDGDRRPLRKCPAQHSSESTDHSRSAHSRLCSARFRSRRSS